MWILFFILQFTSKYNCIHDHTKMLIRTIIIFIILLTLVRCYECLSVQEGEMAQLDFQYPCDSTEVTLQRSNGAPFYSSTNPDVMSQSNKIVTNHKGNDSCSLQLTINPVSRTDQGTYIPIAYKNGRMINPKEDRRIWLSVDYPPGKASCELGRGYVPEEWVKLHCTASKGSLPGEILSFQNGMRLPPLMPPHENDRTVDQTILARIHVDDPVYCCSSILSEAKYMCDCKDWGWNPDLDILLSNIDPCDAPLTAHNSSSKDPGRDSTTLTPTAIPLLHEHIITERNSNPTPKEDYKRSFIIVAVLFGLSITMMPLVAIVGIKMYKSNSARQIEPPYKQEADSKYYEVVHDKPQEDQV